MKEDQCQEHIIHDLTRAWPRPGEFHTTGCELNRTQYYNMLRTTSHKYHMLRINSISTTCYEASCRNIVVHRYRGKSVRDATRRRQVAPPAFTDYWAPMNGLVGGTYRQAAFLAFTDYFAPMRGKGDATHRPPAASCTSAVTDTVYRLLG